jgi:hypothetical protein
MSLRGAVFRLVFCQLVLMDLAFATLGVRRTWFDVMVDFAIAWWASRDLPGPRGRWH